MLKTLLVHIPSERPIRPVVDGAVSLAMARAAHLDAVSVGYESANVGLAIDGGAAVAAVFELERERALARADAALAVFETEARNAGAFESLGTGCEKRSDNDGVARIYVEHRLGRGVVVAPGHGRGARHESMRNWRRGGLCGEACGCAGGCEDCSCD